MEPELDKYGKLVYANLSKCNDIELTLIKGQILIEHLLNRFIESSIKNPMEFDSTKFTFLEKFKISLMLGLPAEIKTEITLIYKLRNQIAHKLSYDTELLTNFLKGISKYYQFHKEGVPLVFEVRSAISFLCGALYASVLVNRPDFLQILDEELEDK